jgi:hypothetical protein
LKKNKAEKETKTEDAPLNPILASVLKEIDDAIEALQDARAAIVKRNKNLKPDDRVAEIPKKASKLLRAM